MHTQRPPACPPGGRCRICIPLPISLVLIIGMFSIRRISNLYIPIHSHIPEPRLRDMAMDRDRVGIEIRHAMHNYPGIGLIGIRRNERTPPWLSWKLKVGASYSRRRSAIFGCVSCMQCNMQSWMVISYIPIGDPVCTQFADDIARQYIIITGSIDTVQVLYNVLISTS